MARKLTVEIPNKGAFAILLRQTEHLVKKISKQSLPFKRRVPRDGQTDNLPRLISTSVRQSNILLKTFPHNFLHQCLRGTAPGQLTG